MNSRANLSLDYATSPALPQQLSLLPNLDKNTRWTDGTIYPSAASPSPVNRGLCLVLAALRDGPTPVQKLQKLYSTGDIFQIIHYLRQHGLEIPCHEVPVPAEDDCINYQLVCVPMPADNRRIKRLIKRFGGDHG